MSSEQEKPVVPPKPYDKDLSDFASIIQDNLEDLYQDSHIHLTLPAAPGSADGRVGDIRIVTISGTSYLYAKVASTLWKRVALS